MTSKQEVWEVGPKWHRRMLSSSLPMNTPNIHLYLEQSLLREKGKPIEQLLYNKRDRPHREGWVFRELA